LKLIKVKFIKEENAFGKEYTYFTTDETIIVGDIVNINNESKGLVTNINVPKVEVESFIDKLKVIKGKASDKNVNTDKEDFKNSNEVKVYEYDGMSIEVIKNKGSFLFTCNVYDMKNTLLITKSIVNSQGFNEVLYWFLNTQVYTDSDKAFEFFNAVVK